MRLLALVACLILIGGWLVRPREVPQSAATVPTETELAQLARRAERRALESTSKYFAGVAREAETSIAYLRSSGVSGVTWDDSRVVTSPLPLGWRRALVTVGAAGVDMTGQLTLTGHSLPLSMVRISAGAAVLSPARPPQSPPAGGDWIVAVWRTATSPAFTVGNFGLSSSVICGVTPVQELTSTLSFTRAMAGGGVFDGEGGLLAVILPCDGRLAAVATESIRSILDRQDSVDAQLRDRFGLGLSPLSGVEAQYFRTTEGLLVRDVWRGYPADAAGIQPGDIVVAVDGAPVTRTEDLSPRMASTDEPLELTLTRGRTRLTKRLVETRDAEPMTGSHGIGLVFEEAPTAYRVESVLPGSPAADAGLRLGDRVVRIDRVEPRNINQVRRLLDSDTPRPVWLEAIRDGRRLGTLVH